MSLKTFEEEDEDVWVVDGFQIADSRPPIRVSVNKEGSPPSIDEIAKIEKMTADIDPLILRVSQLILENYSYDHFKKLGVEESKLVEETPEAVAAAVTLTELSFFDVDGGGFEASFTAPWDPIIPSMSNTKRASQPAAPSTAGGWRSTCDPRWS